MVSVANFEVSKAGGIYHYVRPGPADLTELARLADTGQLTVNVDAALPLAEAAEAFRLSRAGRACGKIVVKVSQAQHGRRSARTVDGIGSAVSEAGWMFGMRGA